MGVGYCADLNGNRLDVHWQSENETMNHAKCLSSCDQQTLCRGVTLASDEKTCRLWVRDGEGPIEGLEDYFNWRDAYNGSIIQQADSYTDFNIYYCYKKGILV